MYSQRKKRFGPFIAVGELTPTQINYFESTGHTYMHLRLLQSNVYIASGPVACFVAMRAEGYYYCCETLIMYSSQIMP